MPRKDTVESQYRIRLRDASGKLRDRRGKSITLSRAKFFDILYKKQELVIYEPFHPRSKAKGKEKKLQTWVEGVIYEHQRALKARAKKAAATRARKKAALVAQEKAKKILAAPIISKVKEELDHKRARLEQSITGHRGKKKGKPYGVVGPVKVIPYKKISKDYDKELIKKVIDTRFGRRASIEILNFMMTVPLEVDKYNFQKSKNKILNFFWPHLLDFFKRTARTFRGITFRIKYDTATQDAKGRFKIIGSGYSSNRSFINPVKGQDRIEILKITPEKKALEIFKRIVIKTFNQFADGKVGVYSEASAYNSILITGFTLENIISLKD